MTRFLATLGVALLVVTFPAVAGAAAAHHKLHGSLTTAAYTTSGFANARPGDECTSTVDLPTPPGEIQAGTPVVIRDAAGKTIAATKLSTGSWQASPAPRGSCLWTFAASVPVTKFYEVSIGKAAGVTFTLRDVKQAHWTVALNQA
jgi:hypothetical protein